MAESKLCWAPLKNALDRSKLHYVRIENRAEPGTPDLNVCLADRQEIWIEMKHIPVAPASDSSAIEIGLRREQFIWLQKASRAGRTCLLLARIGKDWYIWRDALSWEMAKK